MLTFLATTACFVITALAGTPPGYLPATNGSLYVKYGHKNVTEGSTLSYEVPAKAPILSSPVSLTDPTEYLAVFVDPSANLSSPIPAKLLWFQANLTFAANGSKEPFVAKANSPATVPYLAPSVVGHQYIMFLYPQPANFIIPANFPYNATFRAHFNVSRIAADFHVPGPLAANYFTLGPNVTSSTGAPTATGASTGGFASGPTALPFTGDAALISSRMWAWAASSLLAVYLAARAS